MPLKINFYLKSDKNKNGDQLIYMQSKYAAGKLIFSFGQTVHQRNWDNAKMRVAENEETLRTKEYMVNQILDNIEKDANLFYYEELKNGVPSVDSIRNKLKTRYHRRKWVGVAKAKKIRHNYKMGKKYVEDIDPIYVRAVAKKRGFTSEDFKRHPAILPIVEYVLKIHRKCKNEQKTLTTLEQGSLISGMLMKKKIPLPLALTSLLRDQLQT